MITYWIPRTDGAARQDYNPQVYEDGAEKKAGWLTNAEINAKFPPPAPTPPTPEEAHTAKLAEVMSAYSAAFAPIEAVYPAEERETWSVQLEEARAVLADPGAEVPMLSVMVAARGKGETLEAFAELVINNNAAYRLLAGALTGQQQRMYREVNELAGTKGVTAEKIAAYPVAFGMPGGIAGENAGE